MSTLSALVSEGQNAISDAGAGTWAQALIEEWCIAAVRDYSNQLPRKVTHTINCTADVRTYTLPDGFQAAVSVEYPSGQEPPAYLRRRDRQHPRFWQVDGYYDVIHYDDEVNQADQLLISTKPAAGETISLIFQADHIADTEEDDLTVPVRHYPVLLQYAIWCAWRERLGPEEASPTADTLLLSQYAANADRAWRRYTELLNRAKKAAGASGWTRRWEMDGEDRVY